MNNPEIGEWTEFTTQEWQVEGNVLKKIEKAGLYFLGVDFLPVVDGSGIPAKDTEARFDVTAHAHDLHDTQKLNGTMFSCSLGSIYNFPKDFEIKAKIYTATAGIKYRMRYILVLLRDDSQDA